MLLEIDWEDRVWTYDPNRIDVQTAIVIKAHTGMGLKSWAKAVDDLDPVACQALYWAVKHQNGERCEAAGQNFSIMEFMAAFTEATVTALEAEVEAAKARQPDPTRPASRGPTKSTRKRTPTSGG